MKAKPKFSDYACTPNEVEMFVGAIVRKVIPKDFWGSEKNFAHILKCTYLNPIALTLLIMSMS